MAKFNAAHVKEYLLTRRIVIEVEADNKDQAQLLSWDLIPPSDDDRWTETSEITDEYSDGVMPAVTEVTEPTFADLYA